MGKKFFLSFQHFREYRISWLIFFFSTVLILGYGYFQYRINNRLRRDTLYLTELQFKEKLLALSLDTNGVKNNDADAAIKRLNISYILTDDKDEPIEWSNIYYPRFSLMRGSPVKNTDPPFIFKEELRKKTSEFSNERPPITLAENGSTAGRYRIYYHCPYSIADKPWFIFLEIIVLLFFIYIYYSGIKNRGLIKQANLWVNFAKETAHQLGTPLSSLYGWLEMLKMKLFNEHEDISKIQYVLEEAIEDVKKLNKRVFRFSQIGSDPELSSGDLNDIVKETIAYFRDRLPRAERTIQIVANYGELPVMQLNRDLMGWVVENLLKNSMDAIQKKEGIIQVETSYLVKDNRVRITHTDNGSGIKKDNVGKIFNPGFSTKKHGWGLGLALAKRIVTDYHFGLIYVESTQVDRGTTFIIELPVRKSPVHEKQRIKTA